MRNLDEPIFLLLSSLYKPIFYILKPLLKPIFCSRGTGEPVNVHVLSKMILIMLTTCIGYIQCIIRLVCRCVTFRDMKRYRSSIILKSYVIENIGKILVLVFLNALETSWLTILYSISYNLCSRVHNKLPCLKMTMNYKDL